MTEAERTYGGYTLENIEHYGRASIATNAARDLATHIRELTAERGKAEEERARRLELGTAYKARRDQVEQLQAALTQSEEERKRARQDALEEAMAAIRKLKEPPTPQPYLFPLSEALDAIEALALAPVDQTEQPK